MQTNARRLASEVHPLSNVDLAIVTSGRLAINIAYRILYPLLPFLSGRLQLDLQTISLLVTVQVIAGLVSPVSGLLSEARGPRTTMIGGLALFCAGAVLCALSGSFASFLVGYALVGVSSAFYHPAAQAYLSARTLYAQRGWVLGIFELGWAASALIGVAPLMLLVQRTNATAPVYWVLLVVALSAMMLIYAVLPPLAAPVRQTARVMLDWRSLRMPRVLALLGLLVLTACGVDLVFIIQSAWLKTSFGATEAQLGQIFGLMGIAEFGGSIGSTLLVDRVGKKRSVVIGYVLTAVCAAGLGLSGTSWLAAITLLFLFDLCFEFSIVASFPLASGVAPSVRATVLTLTVAAFGTGRAISSRISEPIWSHYGITTIGLISAVLLLAGVALCVLFVQETEQHE